MFSRLRFLRCTAVVVVDFQFVTTLGNCGADASCDSAGTLNGTNAWARFDKVDFGLGKLKSVSARALPTNGATVQIRVDGSNGRLLATVKCSKGRNWTVVKAKASDVPAGIHDLFVSQVGSKPVDLDWISFQ